MKKLQDKMFEISCLIELFISLFVGAAVVIRAEVIDMVKSVSELVLGVAFHAIASLKYPQIRQHNRIFCRALTQKSYTENS